MGKHFCHRFHPFGFDTQRINGNDVEAVYGAIEKAAKVTGKPHAIILDTIKGAGIKEVEETLSNHSMNVKSEVYDGWIAALTAERAALSAK